jgi:hypothetical protein
MFFAKTSFLDENRLSAIFDKACHFIILAYRNFFLEKILQANFWSDFWRNFLGKNTEEVFLGI